MGLSIGIVGLPNVGKSTLFNTLTKKGVESSNYPFCTIDPNIGIVNVSDDRLEKLAKISQSEKVIPAAVEFVDIAGLVKGAHKGEGLGNKFLSNIRECDAICEVVRAFKDDNIIHVNNKINPEEDKETISLELIFADLATVDKRLDKVTREARSGDKEAIALKTALDKIKAGLENEIPVRNIELTEEDKEAMQELQLLTSKPILYVLNVNDNDSGEELKVKENELVLKLNIKLEEDIAQLPQDEQGEYIKELGLEKSGLDRLIASSYKLLNLETFLTTGKQETRAWTIKKGSTAPQAAGVIHTDFEQGFIRVEVINWQDFIDVGGEHKAKEKGLIRTEGKDYIMKDGDVCHFLFN